MSDNEDVKCGWKTRADELSASLVQVAQERDAAKADAARLREALVRLEGCIGWSDTMQQWVCVGRERMMVALDLARKTLAATASDWLAKHDAEVRAKLVEDARRHFRAASVDGAPPETAEGGVAAAAFEAWVAAHDAEVTADMEKALEAQAESVRMYAARVASLEAQLAAATNDAARAELRARDLTEALAHWDTAFTAWQEGRAGDAKTTDERIAQMRNLLAAAPDSDARLREVVERVALMALREGDLQLPDGGGYEEYKVIVPRIVDKVLGVKS